MSKEAGTRISLQLGVGGHAREAHPGHRKVGQVADSAHVQSSHGCRGLGSTLCHQSLQKSQHVAVWQTHGRQQVQTGIPRSPKSHATQRLGAFQRGTLGGFWAEEGFDQNSVLGSVTIIFFF